MSFYQTRGEQLHTLQPHVQYCDHPMGCFQLFNVTKHVCAYFWLIVSITRVDTVSESCNIVRHSAFQYISMYLVELFMSGKQMCSSIISTRYIFIVVVELNYLHPFHLHPDSLHPDPPALMQCLHLLHNNCRSCSVLFSYSHIYNLFLPITCIC